MEKPVDDVTEEIEESEELETEEAEEAKACQSHGDEVFCGSKTKILRANKVGTPNTCANECIPRCPVETSKIHCKEVAPPKPDRASIKHT